jgi:tRNA U34 5-methylaminomethyl-2-thiouridine-forming methyltransferase MnmC
MDEFVEFKGKLGLYKIIETEDQTKTLWSEFFNEACHNLSGAYQETLYNYIQGCNINEQINQDIDVHVFDVGFGPGLGLTAYVDAIKKMTVTQGKKRTYTSIELDEDLFLWSIKNNFPEYVFSKKDNYYSSIFNLGSDNQLQVTIFIGDGRLTMPYANKQKILPKFTAIFQDAFSPKKNPSLWTVEWFECLKQLSTNEVFLSTYSASVSVRKSMIKAGWKIKSEKGFGQKRTMTKARLIGESDPGLSADLARSPTLELHDL